MLELDVTELLQENLWGYAGSQVTHGTNAAKDTWTAATKDRDLIWEKTSLQDEDIPKLRKFFSEMGDFDEDMPLEELLALTLQWLTLEAREADSDQDVSITDSDFDWELYNELSAAGVVSSTFFKTDDGRIYANLH